MSHSSRILNTLILTTALVLGTTAHSDAEWTITKASIKRVTSYFSRNCATDKYVSEKLCGINRTTLEEASGETVRHYNEAACEPGNGGMEILPLTVSDFNNEHRQTLLTKLSNSLKPDASGGHKAVAERIYELNKILDALPEDTIVSHFSQHGDCGPYAYSREDYFFQTKDGGIQIFTGSYKQ